MVEGGLFDLGENDFFFEVSSFADEDPCGLSHRFNHEAFWHDLEAGEMVVEMFFGTIAPGGYAWVIPKGDGANVGLGIQKTGNVSLRKMLDKFLKTRGLGKIEQLSAGFVPISGPIPKTVKDNVLIVGDAAGQVMATNGGGIPISMICGRIAGNVIAQNFKDNTPLQKYEEEWRANVGPELDNALDTKRMADKAFKRNWTLEMSMKLLGPDRMNRAVNCKPIFKK